VKIKFNIRFQERLWDILSYIEKESSAASIQFENDMYEKIEQLTLFPYKYRQSYYYNDIHIRDYIFKGYTIPYLVDEEKREIVVLDIFKWNRTGENHDT